MVMVVVEVVAVEDVVLVTVMVVVAVVVVEVVAVEDCSSGGRPSSRIKRGSRGCRRRRTHSRYLTPTQPRTSHQGTVHQITIKRFVTSLRNAFTLRLVGGVACVGGWGGVKLSERERQIRKAELSLAERQACKAMLIRLETARKHGSGFSP